MKKYIMLFLVVLLAGCSTTTEPTPEPGNGGAPFGCGVESECDEGSAADMSEYASLEGVGHIYVASDLAAVNSYIENEETFIVYYGFSSCPWCKEMVRVLNDLAKEYDRRVLYVDLKPGGEDLRVDTNEDYNRAVELLGDYMFTNEEGNPTLYVPGVYFIKNGKVLSYNVGTVDTHDAKERLMTEEEVNQLIEIYRAGFEAAKK